MPVVPPRRPTGRFPKLGTRIVVFFVALLVIVQGVAAFLVIQASSQVARRTINQQLEQGERVFRQLLTQNQARLEQGAGILSADFAFRQAIASNDTGTILSVLRNHGARVGANVMTLASLDNTVRADTLDPARIGKPFAYPDLVKLASVDGKSSSIVIRDGKLYQLVVVPVLAPEPIAWVGLAFEVDDAVAKDMHQLTGLEVTFASRVGPSEEWRLHASTLPAQLRPALAVELARLPESADGSGEITLGGDEYETRLAALEQRADKRVVAVLQRPLAVGLAPFQRISAVFFWMTLAGLAVLVAGSLMIARGITRPVHRLADAARRVQQGDYSRHVDVEHRDEIGELAESFNHMLDGIVSREKEILRLAYEDALSGLPNRAMFYEQLGQAVRIARRGGENISVMMLDMDRFKAINDTLGHTVGDQVLREVGARVRTALRDSDIVARLGGDEFGVLLPTGDKEHAPRVVAEKIHRALEQPLVVGGQTMDVAASIGIARFPEHGEDADALLRAADVAMYEAKRTKARYAIYNSSHDERRKEFLTLLGELRHAVEAGELELHFQPKVTLAEERASSVEALVRWRHPKKGMVPPGDFIPFAEQTGYIGEITRWVLRRAIEQCGRWQMNGSRVRMCVNISARDLRQGEELVQFVSARLAEAELPAGMLCLEITESALMEDPAIAQSTLRRLRELGVATSIDDYGTGYSSLAYIKQLAVNELKIDRGFVAGMEADQRNAAIVRSTIELGHNLGLTVVAEGVETEHELAQLRRFGCDAAQGYLFARPMSAPAFERWLSGLRDEAGARAGVAGA
ncbi:MAG TPA: EAL domain-containing protein [Usitatibacter sp.]|jgi:diguanylate cyclase (GGDEF)-like protein|nr:EAL domain-containing protein [Usitatibacter sp.]